MTMPLFELATTLVAGPVYEVDNRAFTRWVDVECTACDRIYPTPERYVPVMLRIPCPCQGPVT